METFYEKLEDKDIDICLFECNLLFGFIPNSSPENAITHIKLDDVANWKRKVTHEYDDGTLEVEYVIHARETIN